MAQETIYDVAGIDALAGLLEARDRMVAGFRSIRQTNTPDPLPKVAPPAELDDIRLDFTIDGYGVRLELRGSYVDHETCAPKCHGMPVDSRRAAIKHHLTPEQILELTEAAMAEAAKVEALAERHAQAVRDAVDQALKSHDPALRRLAAFTKSKDAVDDDRKEWIAKHGSDRLKRCEAEGIECTAIYCDERLALERPGWRWDREVPGYGEKPRNPPLEAFDLLDEARKTAPDATLDYWVVEHECEYGDQDVECKDADDDGECPRYDWRGYVAVAEFLGRDIVFGGPGSDHEVVIED